MTTIGGDLGSRGIYRGDTYSLQLEQTKTQIKSQLSAMDFYLGAGFNNGYIVPRDIKAALREEVAMFKDSLSDWPSDGSQRTLTYRSPVRQPDGSWKLIEITEVMNKEQVQILINQFEQIIATI